jgi:hypothetical protein
MPSNSRLIFWLIGTTSAAFAEQSLLVAKDGGLSSGEFNTLPQTLFEYGSVVRVITEMNTDRAFWATSRTNIDDVKIFVCTSPCKDTTMASVVHRTPRTKGYGYFGAEVLAIRLDLTSSRRHLFVLNYEPTTDSNQANDELISRIDLANNNLKTVILNRTSSNLSKSGPSIYESALSLSIVGADNYAFVFTALGVDRFLRICDYGASIPCSLKTVKSWVGEVSGSRAGSDYTRCSYYRKSSGRLYWATQVSYASTDVMTINLYHDAVDKSSAALAPSLLYAANMTSANWFDFRCDLDIDEAAGTLYFMARYHGIVRLALAGAPAPQLWSNLAPLDALFAMALDTRGSAQAAAAATVTTAATAKANSTRTTPASAHRPAAHAGLLLASALFAGCCLLLP